MRTYRRHRSFLERGDRILWLGNVVRILEVRMPRLPAAFYGLRVVQISDLHVGPHTSARFLSKVVNEAVPVEWGGERLWVAGTGDPAGESRLSREAGAAPDVEGTLADIPPDEPVLALAHNPALWPALADRGVDLTLSGHTHYGQLAIPSKGWSMASAFLELAMGSYREGRSLLYIHPGTNYWGIPFRIGTPPEVAVLTLRSCEDGDASITAGEPRSTRRKS